MMKSRAFAFCIVCALSAITAQEWKMYYPTFIPPLQGAPLYRQTQFLNDRDGWLFGTVGGKHCLWYTSDGAKTWTCRLTDNAQDKTWMAVHFVDPSHGWILLRVFARKDSAAIYKTSDSGINWTVEYPTHKFNSIYFTDTSTGVANTNDTIFRTTDGGKTWIALKVNTPYRFDIREYFFINPEKGWAIGINGSIVDDEMVFMTVDSGKTWSVLLAQSFPLTGIFFVDENRGYLSGTKAMQQTVDGGKTWTIKGPAGKDVFFTSPAEGWCVGAYGAIRQTVDSGSTWQLVQNELLNNEQAIFTNVAFLGNGKTGFVSGHNGYILTYDATTKLIHASAGPRMDLRALQTTVFFQTRAGPRLPESVRHFSLAGKLLPPEKLTGMSSMPYLRVVKK
jgi:photosystem II stability/assembly factor-like uncharacterized protein